jgi:hypothetical protein
MTISGGIKFFKRNTALFSSGTTATASSNSSSANNILTNRQLTYWQSIGSDDTTTETITITYNKTVTIDRILLNRINFKEFTVQYDVAGTPTDFTNVIGLDGALVGGISETAFADETAYYEFDSISTTGIIITATKTQTADQEKLIYNLFTTEELGTLEGYPQISAIDINRGDNVSRGLSRLANVQKGYETKEFSIDFNNYPSQSDYDLVKTLVDSQDSFLVWLCGGRRGTAYFRFLIDAYKLRDIINMQTSGGIKPFYPNGVYINAPSVSINLLNSR